MIVNPRVVAQPPMPQVDAAEPTPGQIYAEALRQATGAPARVELAGQATLRLAEDALMIPRAPAEKVLASIGQPVPSDMVGLLFGLEGLDTKAPIRFVPSGFIDADAILAWTPEDILTSMADTVRRLNQPPLDARRWIQPPVYDRESHHLTWAALIVQAGASPESGGEVSYNAVAFGRYGYLALSVPGSVEQADKAMRLIHLFLDGLRFLPGRDYTDAVPSDPRAPGGLASAMALDAFRKAPVVSAWFNENLLLPVAGGLAALVGALALFISVNRLVRQRARRS